jgi:hypothetical protein
MTEVPPTTFEVNVPPEKREGHYADYAGIWHNQETFILDFVAMTEPPAEKQDAEGETINAVPCEVVTRVRIPASQAWEMMKALEKQLTAWEAENPQRKQPPSTAA